MQRLFLAAAVGCVAPASAGVTPAGGGTVRAAGFRMDFSVGLVAAPLASGGEFSLQSSVLVPQGDGQDAAIFGNGFETSLTGATP